MRLYANTRPIGLQARVHSHRPSVQTRHFFNITSFSSTLRSSASKSRGLFGVEDLHAPEDFSRLAAHAVRQAREDINQLKATKVGVVRGLDDISNNLCGIADAAELCRNVHPDSFWVRHGNEAVTMVAEFMSEVNLDRDIFNLLRTAPTEGYSDELAVVHKHMKESMEHEGVGLPDEQKNRCLHLLDRELALSFDLSTPGSEPEIWIPKSALQEVKADSLKGFRTRGKGDDSEVLVNAQFAEAVSRMVSDSRARQIVYDAHLQEDPERRNMLLELLQTRQELAQIRGYQNWNAYAQRDSILEGSAGVFLEDAWRILQPKVEEEVDMLRQLKKSFNSESLEPWDIAFFLQQATEAMRKPGEKSGIPRLTYSQLLLGVSRICSEMLNVDFVQETGEAAQCVWHPGVQKFSLRKDGEVLGILYLDCFTRPGKKTQSAQFTLRGSKIVNSRRQIPSTALVCIMHPSEPLPSSVSMTFMHEIGHALHSLLSCTEMQHLSGTRGTVDFVEFPSHLFEYFATEPEAVMRYSPSHKKLERRKAPFRHVEAAQQLFLAQVDHNFYSCPNSALDNLGSVYEHVIGGLCPTAKLLTPHALTKFEHLIHYGGSYYCYLLNKAMAAHVWEEGFRNAPFGAAAGKRLTDFFRSGSTSQHMRELERLLPEGAPRLTYRGSDPTKIHVSLNALMKQLQ